MMAIEMDLIEIRHQTAENQLEELDDSQLTPDELYLAEVREHDEVVDQLFGYC